MQAFKRGLMAVGAITALTAIGLPAAAMQVDERNVPVVQAESKTLLAQYYAPPPRYYYPPPPPPAYAAQPYYPPAPPSYRTDNGDSRYAYPDRNARAYLEEREREETRQLNLEQLDPEDPYDDDDDDDRY